MPLVGMPVMFGQQGALPLILTFLGNDIKSSGGSTHTFTSKTLGIGHIVVGAGTYAGSNHQLSSVTIDGVSATMLARNTGTATQELAELWIAPCSSSSGDIVINDSASSLNCGIGWWLIENLGSTTAQDTANGSNATTVGLTIDCPATGCIIAYARQRTSGVNWVHTGASDTFDTTQTSRAVSVTRGSGSNSWTNLTERYDQVINTGVGSTDIGACAVSLL